MKIIIRVGVTRGRCQVDTGRKLDPPVVRVVQFVGCCRTMIFYNDMNLSNRQQFLLVFTICRFERIDKMCFRVVSVSEYCGHADVSPGRDDKYLDMQMSAQGGMKTILTKEKSPPIQDDTSILQNERTYTYERESREKIYLC